MKLKLRWYGGALKFVFGVGGVIGGVNDYIFDGRELEDLKNKQIRELAKQYLMIL
jgi:hypothetical protein